MDLERRHISVHIEKTAGTSLHNFYRYLYGPSRVLLFNTRNNLLNRSSDIKASLVNPHIDRLRRLAGSMPFLQLLPLANKAYLLLVGSTTKSYGLDNLPPDFSVIHGHFLATMTDQFIPDSFKTIILRDPLERMISHYQHWKRNSGATNFRVRAPLPLDTTFEQFALLPIFTNYQSQALDGLALSEFDLVGTTNKLIIFARELARLRDGFETEISLSTLNQSPNKHNAYKNLDQDFLRKFRQQHELDYELYQYAINFL